MLTAGEMSGRAVASCAAGPCSGVPGMAVDLVACESPVNLREDEGAKVRSRSDGAWNPGIWGGRGPTEGFVRDSGETRGPRALTCCRRRPRRWACGSAAFPASFAAEPARRRPCFRPGASRSSPASASCRGLAYSLRRRCRKPSALTRLAEPELSLDAPGTRDEASRRLRAHRSVRSRETAGV